ncbi:ATP-binding cassette, subfamily B, MsbA [Palleronia marisminoris]|uniref:Heterocyst differentiation ATP-binding protein HepA n=1 Tax=Palleronia marisminoris TaxID=315423 RepID=A0A1Y5TSM0_9RHOB|nr:ABC transporter ATP-binding protein [Palleronia marisminoris]SFH50534.1 ATP-binding cassette, subfamily B, MsbA [Palleronia marisminoris]SLN70465.1 Heterocyst differentiation ATP-binding protein HepA [Palleronia marisminoris]
MADSFANSQPPVSAPREDAPSPGREAVALLTIMPNRKLLMVAAIGLGIVASAAEALSIGLAVLLLFSVFGELAPGQASSGVLEMLNSSVLGFLGGGQVLIAAVFAALFLISAGFMYANNLLIGVISNRVAQQGRDMIHDRYIRMSYRDMQGLEPGELIHILSTESWTLGEGVSCLIRAIVAGCAVAVFTCGLFLISWPLGLIAVVGGAVAFAVLQLFSWSARRRGRRTLEANYTLSERMLVSVTGMRTLRLFAQEDDLAHRFRDASRLVSRRAIREEVIKSGSGPLVQLLALLVLVLLVACAVAFGIDEAAAVTAVMLIFRAQPYLNELETNRVSLAGLAPALAQVRRVRQWPVQPSPGRGEPFQGLREAIRFEDVDFAHDARLGSNLNGVSFEIRAGRTTALSGPSGSGKTTILNLLMRLYDPQSGRITADGTDIACFDRKSWLEGIAIAGQDIELLEGTLRQNLLVARPTATTDEIEQVCHDVEIFDMIAALPEGLETPVGAVAHRFSGGQRQRIGLARALLRDPDIMLLDEATSALETALEDRIRDRIFERLKGRTIILVSHRSGTAHMADDVIRIEDGRVTETRGGQPADQA